MKRKWGIVLFGLLLTVSLLVGPLLAAPEANEPPVAKPDLLQALTKQENSFVAGTLFADNGSGADDRGSPLAVVESFGGGGAGGNVTTHAAGAEVDFGGGKLTVRADGSLLVKDVTETGFLSFSYRLRNGVGFDDAPVNVNMLALPLAKDDYYSFLYTADQTVAAAGGLFAENGSGEDDLGYLPGTLSSFGGEAAGGNVNSYAAGSEVDFAGGKLQVNADGSWGLSGAPFTPGLHTFLYKLANSSGTDTARVSLSIQIKPAAADDDLAAALAPAVSFPLGTLFNENGHGEDDFGEPQAALVSFGGGDAGGDATTYAPGAEADLAGGKLSVQVDGAVTLNGATNAGRYTFAYRLQNEAGFSEATVTLDLNQAPTAAPDAYLFLNTADQSKTAGALFTNNGSGPDDRGHPQALIASFGGGDLGGDAGSNAAGSAAALAGGTLTVNGAGGWTLTGEPFAHGQYSFDYRLVNSSGASQATVTLTIEAAPVAEDDVLATLQGTPLDLPAGALFADNGSGVDDLGRPLGALISFGGGDLGGDPGSNGPGASVPLAGGLLTVGGDGSLSLTTPTALGAYSFSYRLGNSRGNSTAQVTLIVAAPPAAADDVYEFAAGGDIVVDAAAGVFADNGGGADDLGTPPATVASFGGGDLGGAVSDNLAGSTLDLAGGQLTVNSAGDWSLMGAPLTPGVYTFLYRLSNAGGESDATVTLRLVGPPQARADLLNAAQEMTTTYGAGKLFADNGAGADVLAYPAAELVSFGGGDAPGGAGDNAPGIKVPFAGGELLVNSDGSLEIIDPLQAGEYTFSYRLENAEGSSEALVTVTVLRGTSEIYLPVLYR